MAGQYVTEELAEVADARSERAARRGDLFFSIVGSWRSRKVLIDLAAMLAGAAVAFWVLGRWEMICASLWWIAVVVVIRSDLDGFVIPDEASAAIAVLGLVHVCAVPIGDGRPLRVAADAAWGGLLGGAGAFAVFWLIAWLYRHRTGREGLGFGDVKLAGASAIWLEPMSQVVALEVAALAAIASVLLFRRGRQAREAAIPFGAFLAPSAWLVFVAGPVFDRWR